MISVIICSVNKDFARQVKRNIEETIGVDWELILIDNLELKKGITHVYNLGASRARFGILCFVHEDVLFSTPDWGRTLVSIFNSDASIGLVGVAGGKYKSRTFSGWSTGDKQLDCCNILHLDPDGREHRIYVNPDPASRLHEVVVTDGVFMCVPRKVWEEIPHNETLITGFHLYDLDYSFAVSARYKVMVTFDIDITHLTTGGDYGNKWVNYTMDWHRHYRAALPKSVAAASPIPRRIESRIRQGWLHRLRTEKISFRNKIRWIFSSGAVTDLMNWPYIGLFFLFRLIKK